MNLTTQELLFRAGKEIVITWLDYNDIPRPIILRNNELVKARRSVREHLTVIGLQPETTLGHYYRSHIFINVLDTSLVGDDTAVETLAHEIGHYVFHQWQIQAQTWRECLRNTGLIDTVSEYTTEESFAETLRVFILRPRQLKRYWPARWRLLTYDLELRPLLGLMI
jgi:hypothetical protein